VVHIYTQKKRVASLKINASIDQQHNAEDVSVILVGLCGFCVVRRDNALDVISTENDRHWPAGKERTGQHEKTRLLTAMLSLGLLGIRF